MAVQADPINGGASGLGGYWALIERGKDIPSIAVQAGWEVIGLLKILK